MKMQENQIIFLIRFCCSVLLCTVLLFFFCSLVTYNKHDPSLFFVTSETKDIANMCGPLGAECAALFFYIFGGAAFLWCVPLLFFVYLLMRGCNLSCQWERVTALCYGIYVYCALLATYMVDFSWSPYPGGIVGLRVAYYLEYYFDSLGRLFFLYTSLLAVCIMSWRFSSMRVIHYLMRMSTLSVESIKKYRIVQRCVMGVLFILQLIFIKPLQFLYAFMQSLYDGTALDETDLLVPGHGELYDTHEFVSLSTVEYAEMPTETLSIIEPPVQSVVQLLVEENVQNVPLDEPKVPRYALPTPDIFVYEKNEKDDHDLEHELQKRAVILQDKLKRFGVSGEVVAIKRGPVVTLFEYQPDIDIKLSKILALEDDLAMALQALSIRILAPIPGKAVVGFEVANAKRNDVLFSHIVTTPLYKDFKGALPLILGKGTIGEPVIVDLARMPHVLIAGSTGSGKSVALNALLVSLLCKLNPDELKLILIDPKRLEFSSFADIAHLLFPIVTSPNLAAPVLRWVVQEMENRYEKMAERGARNVTDYNNLLLSRGESNKLLPSIVVVIDELADLMLTVGRDIEDLITRITQMARAAGIHMIVATQRPSVDVITGLIKANFPSRISFRVASRIDSRTILDTVGADRLLGRGDMLFLDASTSQLRRVHGAYVSDQEIDLIVNHIRSQRHVEYLDIYNEIRESVQNASSIDDPLYQDICLFLNEVDEISISLVQRKFRIGYNRSARIIDILESQGLIMPQDGGKTRKVIR